MMTFHGAGLSVAPEIAAGCEKSEEVGCVMFLYIQFLILDHNMVFEKLIQFSKMRKNNVSWLLHDTASDQCRLYFITTISARALSSILKMINQSCRY